MGKGWGTPRWEYDTVRRRGGRCRRTGQEAGYPSEGIMAEVGADRGYGKIAK